MQAFHKLPEPLQKELQRWYIVSAGALIIALLGMTCAHLITSFSVQKMAQKFPVAAVTSAPLPQLDETLIQQRLQELDLLFNEQSQFFPFMVACLELLPADFIKLNQFTVTAKKTFTCSGQALTSSLVTDYVSALHTHGLACTQMDISSNPQQKLPIVFQIAAKQCSKG